MQLITANVLAQLKLTAKKMQIKCNKNLKFIDYLPRQKVWLNTKYYKTGENRKCAPRRDGLWTIMEKLNNGVNIRNDNSKEFKIVHHDRFRPANLIRKETRRTVAKKTNDRLPQTLPEEYESSSSDESDSKDENEAVNMPRRYTWERTVRRIPGAIPWEAIENG